MYPLLVMALNTANIHDPLEGLYPEEALRDGFTHVPLLSYCRHNVYLAIRECGGLQDINTPGLLRWRASIPNNVQSIIRAHESRLELFLVNETTGVVDMVYTAPLCGNEFEKLPLVLRLGIELLYRKECRGNDPE